MNWRLLLPIGKSTEPPQFAPIFATARGLFREHSDQELVRRSQKFGRAKFIQDYAERSCPVFGTGKARRDNHFDLIEWTLKNHPDRLGTHIRRFFRPVSVPAIQRMLNRRFRRIVTPLRIEFITDLLDIRVGRIREILSAPTEQR